MAKRRHLDPEALVAFEYLDACLVLSCREAFRAVSQDEGLYRYASKLGKQYMNGQLKAQPVPVVGVARLGPRRREENTPCPSLPSESTRTS